MLPLSHMIRPLYTLNFVTVGTRIIIIIIIIIIIVVVVVVVVVVVLQKHNAEQKTRQGKRYAAEKAGAAPKRTKEQSVFRKDVSYASSLLCFI